jgi:hypothetical protein
VRPAASDVEAISSVAGSAQVMGIDRKGMNTILGILSNMYSDGNYAVVREYSSNALDSHIAAGNDGPILITSPSLLDPVFTVQDFGTGLSRDEVLNVFAMYGASTKRDTDDQIGSFGIGAKSAFTVGTQFIVTAVKDGWQTAALFALNDEGAPTVNILSHQETDEPNGVQVKIGVRDVNGIKDAIERLFPTWKRGTVLVDGIEPVSVWDNLEKLSGDLYMGFRNGNYSYNLDSAWTVVMGGIPYKVPLSVINSLDMRQRTIITRVQSSQVKVYRDLPIGSVDITPSREELRVTPKTIATVAKMAEDFMTYVAPWITKQISGADSIGAALIAFHGMRHKLGTIGDDTMKNITWHGKPLPTVTVNLEMAEHFTLHSRGFYGDKTARRYKGIKLGPSIGLQRYIFVTHVPERRIRSVQLAAKPFLQSQDKEDGIQVVVALKDNPDNYKMEWFDPSDPAYVSISFDDFIRVWKPKTTPAQRGEVRYTVYGEADLFTVDELKVEPKVFYLTYGERFINHRSVIGKMTADGNVIVMLTGTQKPEVFVKRVPGAIHLPGAMKENAREFLDSLGNDDLEAMFRRSVLTSVDNHLLSFLVPLRSQITNPVVQDAMRIYEDASHHQSTNRDKISLIQSASEYAERSMPVADGNKEKLETLRKVATGLPLLYAYIQHSRYDSGKGALGRQHVIDYINSIKL